MEFIPADTVDTERLPEGVDIRTVSVIWVDGSDSPVIDYTGCSGYEAEGLMRAALKRLAKANASAMVFLEEELEYEEDESDDDEG